MLIEVQYNPTSESLGNDRNVSLCEREIFPLNIAPKTFGTSY